MYLKVTEILPFSLPPTGPSKSYNTHFKRAESVILSTLGVEFKGPILTRRGYEFVNPSQWDFDEGFIKQI